jgi:ribonuclease D
MIFKTISKEEIDLLPLTQFEGELVVVDDLADVDRIVNKIRTYDVVGFDTETKPSFKKGSVNQVSLLQISTADTAFLFRVNKIGIPPQVIALLEDESTLKVGVAVRDDLKHLNRVGSFVPRGFIELQNVAKNMGMAESSLKKLAALLLGIRISKRQRLTNWESDELTLPQLIYGATDAWVSLKIYNRMCQFDTLRNYEQVEL